MKSLSKTLRFFALAGLVVTAVETGKAALVLQYTFDDAASPTADSAANPANGTVIGSGAFVTNTPSGTGSAFNTGGTSYVTTGTTANPDGGTDPAKLDTLTTFTITMWVNLQGAVAANDRLASDWNPELTAGFDFRYNTNDGQLILNVDDVAASSGTARVGVTQNVWRFVAVTYDGTAGSANVRFYTGDLAAAVAQLGATASIGSGPAGSNTVDFQVGGTAASASDRTPNAFFDDVRIYDEVLSQSALEAIRASAIPEASSAMLAGLAGAGLLMRRSRKVRR